MCAVCFPQTLTDTCLVACTQMDLLNQVSLEKHPEMVLLLNPKEDLKSFAFLPPEQTLLRWFNYHLRRAGTQRQACFFPSKYTIIDRLTITNP